MMSGLATKEEGVIDGRFYSHLGDALARLGRHEEAQQVKERLKRIRIQIIHTNFHRTNMTSRSTPMVKRKVFFVRVTSVHSTM